MTHLINCDTLCHKSHRVRNKMRTSEGLFSMKRFTAPQHTRSILPPIHPTKSSLRCVSGIFLLILTNWQSGHSFPQCLAGKIPKSGGTLVGTQLCLQSLVCYALVPADAEKGLRANAASSCSVAEGCVDEHAVDNLRPPSAGLQRNQWCTFSFLSQQRFSYKPQGK